MERPQQQTTPLTAAGGTEKRALDEKATLANKDANGKKQKSEQTAAERQWIIHREANEGALTHALPLEKWVDSSVLLSLAAIRGNALPKHSITDVWLELPGASFEATEKLLDEFSANLIATEIVTPHKTLLFVQSTSLEPLLQAYQSFSRSGFLLVAVPLVVNLSHGLHDHPREPCHQIWIFTNAERAPQIVGVFRSQSNCFEAHVIDLHPGRVSLPHATIAPIMQGLHLANDFNQNRHALLWRPQLAAEILFGFAFACRLSEDNSNYESLFEKVSVVAEEKQFPEIVSDYVKLVAASPDSVVTAVVHDQSPIGPTLRHEAAKAAKRHASRKGEERVKATEASFA